MLKRSNKPPRVPVAPVHDAEGQVIADTEALTVLWVQQFSEEFASNVVGVAQDKNVLYWETGRFKRKGEANKLQPKASKVPKA